jgi:hypothetical protein
MTIDQWVERFKRDVRAEHVTVDWDGGHAYHGIDHPSADYSEFDGTDDEETCYEMCRELWDEQGPELICEPLGGCGCTDHLSAGELLDHTNSYVTFINSDVRNEYMKKYIAETTENVMKEVVIRFKNQLTLTTKRD